MKLDYDYFLMRRNITTVTIIKTNNIKTYGEFVKLLVTLKVIPPDEEYFNKEYLTLYPPAKPATRRKKKKVVKSDVDIQKKERDSAKSSTGGSNKTERPKRTRSFKSRALSKEKSSD